MRIIVFIFLLLLLIFGIAFAYLNASPVSFNYFLGARQIPLSLLVALTLVVGICLGLLVAFFPMIKLKGKNVSLKKRLKQAEQEVQNLRAIPLQDQV